MTIESIAAGGEGVGRLRDGRAVFVHRTAPGDVTEVAVIQDRPRWARAKLVRVLERSAMRREPPCPHYAECGGCSLEHVDYDAQLAIKAEIVTETLARIGGLSRGPVGVVGSPEEFRYRNRVSFAVKRLRRGGIVAGFHALHDPGRIVDIDGRCLLPEEPIGTAWDRVRDVLSRHSSDVPERGLRVTLRATGAGEISILLEGDGAIPLGERLLQEDPTVRSVWAKAAGDAATPVAASPGLPETWGEEVFELGGTAFLQVNRRAARLLEDYVLELAGNVAGQQVVDAYCGVGLHARRLARQGATVVGIELDSAAIEIAAAANLPGTIFVQARVENVISRHLPCDLLILNPPRAGIAAEVSDMILSAPAGRIIYISCDPASLARDLKRLAPVYRMESIRCFDLFPQTAHVETVVALTPLSDG